MPGLAMKVVAVTNDLSERGGGIPPAVVPLCERLTGRGVEVVLAAAQQPNHTIGTRVANYRVLGSKTFGFSPDLLGILDREQPNLVHLHGLWTYGSIAVRIWQRRTGKPVVVSPHGMLDPWALRNRGFKKWIALAAYESGNLRDASCLHSLTEHESRSLKDLGFNDRVVTIPNGVDLAKGVALQKQDFSGRRTLLYLGRLHPKKGIAETLVAWSLFQKEPANGAARWRLLVAGWDDGGHLQQLRDIVRRYKLEERVTFTGPVFGAQKDTMYANADAVILASHSEGLPMTVLEAWAFAKPVFITEQCNLPEGFRAGAAFRITTDPKNIAATLASVLPDRNGLIRAGQAGRALAETSFDWLGICERWVSLYRSILCRPSAKLRA
jgi:glycosyltransferase involved in cell wall biosynthesis